MNFRAIVFGSTGLTGKHLTQLALDNTGYQHVCAVSRRQLSVKDFIDDSSANHQRLSCVAFAPKPFPIDQQQTDELNELIRSFDHLYICLGTTMRQAGSKQAFRDIDLEYVFALASIAAQNNVSRIVIVSAVNANPNSPFFYSRVKGELEKRLRTLATKYPHTQIIIAKPSLLLGNRNEHRMGENLAQKIAGLFNRLLPKKLSRFRATSAKAMAQAMIDTAHQQNFSSNPAQLFFDDFNPS